jgi:hypothetical protein
LTVVALTKLQKIAVAALANRNSFSSSSEKQMAVEVSVNKK